MREKRGRICRYKAGRNEDSMLRQVALFTFHRPLGISGFSVEGFSVFLACCVCVCSQLDVLSNQSLFFCLSRKSGASAVSFRSDGSVA